MSPQTLVNGVADSHPLIGSRLVYGDGLFETIAVRNGQLRHWGLHIERLQAGCSKLRMRQPDPNQLLDEVSQLLDT
ncbi:MAG: aminotransferase class IV, partial [Pseudomonadota bacterium]